MEHKISIPSKHQRLIFSGRHVELGNILNHYGIEKDSTVDVCLSMRGGGPKVIKSVLKTKKSETTSASDGDLFTSAFQCATLIHQITTVNIEKALKDMPLDKLKSLEQWMKHDKAPRAAKAAKVHEYFAEHAVLEQALNKLISAKERMKELSIEALEGEDGFDFAAFTQKVSNIIYSREQAASSNMQS